MRNVLVRLHGTPCVETLTAFLWQAFKRTRFKACQGTLEGIHKTAKQLIVFFKVQWKC